VELAETSLNDISGRARVSDLADGLAMRLAWSTARSSNGTPDRHSATSAERAPRAVNHSTTLSWRVPVPFAASSGVPLA
jgi:hypothetical protein